MEIAAKNIISRAVLMQVLAESTLTQCQFIEQKQFKNKNARIYTKLNF